MPTFSKRYQGVKMKAKEIPSPIDTKAITQNQEVVNDVQSIKQKVNRLRLSQYASFNS